MDVQRTRTRASIADRRCSEVAVGDSNAVSHAVDTTLWRCRHRTPAECRASMPKRWGGMASIFVLDNTQTLHAAIV